MTPGTAQRCSRAGLGLGAPWPLSLVELPTWGPWHSRVWKWAGGSSARRSRPPRVEAQAGLSPHVPPRTFNYILRELPKVPTHVPVCVLGNYRDMGEHRVILPGDVRDVLDHLDRWAHACPQTHPPPGCTSAPPAHACHPWMCARHPLPPPRARAPGHACCTAPPEPRPPLQLQGPRPSWRQTWAGSGPSSPRVQQECCPPPWGAWVGWAVRSCRDRRLQWPGLGVHRRAPRLAKLSEPNVSIWDSGPITCWSTQRPGALPPGRLGLGASSAQRACPSCLSLSCLCSFANRPPGSSYFRYAESSMKNSFGLKYLHRFFNIPFLQLQVSAAGRGRAWSHQSGCPRLVGELDRSGTTGPAVGPPCVRAGASQRHGPQQPPALMAAPLSPPWAWALCRQLQGLRSPRLPPPGWLPSLESRSPFCWGMRLGLQKKQRLPVPWLSSPPPAPLAPHVAVAALQPAVAPETCLVRGLTLDQWWAFKASPRR